MRQMEIHCEELPASKFKLPSGHGRVWFPAVNRSAFSDDYIKRLWSKTMGAVDWFVGDEHNPLLVTRQQTYKPFFVMHATTHAYQCDNSASHVASRMNSINYQEEIKPGEPSKLQTIDVSIGLRMDACTHVCNSTWMVNLFGPTLTLHNLYETHIMEVATKMLYAKAYMIHWLKCRPGSGFNRERHDQVAHDRFAEYAEQYAIMAINHLRHMNNRTDQFDTDNKPIRHTNGSGVTRANRTVNL